MGPPRITDLTPSLAYDFMMWSIGTNLKGHDDIRSGEREVGLKLSRV